MIKKNRDKILSGGLIFLLVLVVVAEIIFACCLADGFKNREKFNFYEICQEDTDKTSDGGMVIGEVSRDGLSLTSTEIETSDYQTYGVSPLAETAYTLTATVTPSEVSNVFVDWSVEFADSDSEWARGKNVTDYVVVTPVSNGALTATAECKAEFGEQIIIKVTSRDNPEIFASCSVDYMKRMDNVSISVSATLENQIAVGKITNFAIDIGYGTGTVTGACTTESIFIFDETFRQAVHNNENFRLAYLSFGGSSNLLWVEQEISLTVDNGTFLFSDTKEFVGCGGVPNASTYSFFNTAFCQEADAFDGKIGEIHTVVTCKYGDTTETKTIITDIESIDLSETTISISDLTLNNSALIF